MAIAKKIARSIARSLGFSVSSQGQSLANQLDFSNKFNSQYVAILLAEDF